MTTATTRPHDEVAQLRLTVDTLEAQRSVLGDTAVDLALGPLRARLAALGAAPIRDETRERDTVVGEHKVVTVVFADVSGFTAMSERMSSEDVRDVMNGLFERLVPAIATYGGVVDKFIGDEIMALFGAPQATEHHVDHALRACLAMFGELAAFNEQHELALGLHIGVNAGQVVAGGVGSTQRHDYSVMGDVVNVASRLKDASETGEILVGPAVQRAAATAFEFEALAPLTLKGRSQALPVFRLLAARPRPELPTDEFVLAFEGRDTQLENVVRLIRNGTPAVTLVGEAGLGKSRLVREVRRELGPTWPWFETAAMTHRSGVSYSVVQDLFDEILGLPPGADVLKIGQALDAHVAALGLGSEVAAYLRRFRDLPVSEGDEAAFSGLAPEVLRRRLRRSVGELFASATVGSRVLFCIEDLHWADSSSISLLTEIVVAGWVPGASFLVTARTDAPRVVPWLDQFPPGETDVVVELSPLSREAVTALLGRTLVTPDPDSMLRAALLERSEGNPFYLVSYLRSLLDDRTAVLNGGQVRLSIEPDSLQLPDSMHAVVGERVDRLDAAGKSLLRLASVIGRRFSLERLFDFASSMQFRDSAVVLEDLRTRQLIEKAGVGHVQFTHAVVQDVVYAGMLGRERRRLHLAFASTLAAQMNPDDAVVAWHLEQAGEMHDASVRYEAASERAQAVYAHLDALAHVERAFALTSVDEASRRPRLVERAGDLLLLTGRFLDATERFSTIADDSTDLDGARCNRKYAHALMACQRADQAVARIAVARGDLADIPVNARGNAWWREHFAVQIERLWLLYQTASEDMRAVALQLAPELEAHGLPVESGLYHRSLALLELRTSRYLADESVVRLAERGARELATADDRTSACFANFTHAFTLLWSGDIVAADRKLHDVLDEARRIGDAERHLMCLTYLAVTARFRHDVDGARAFATAGVAAARTAGARLYEGVNSANLAWADWRVQRASPDQSRVQLDAAVALMASTPGYPFWWIATLLDLALVQDTEDVSTVASLCESLIVPSQQRLPDPLAATMTHVVTSPSLENVRVVCDAAMLTGHL